MGSKGMQTLAIYMEEKWTGQALAFIMGVINWVLMFGLCRDKKDWTHKSSHTLPLCNGLRHSSIVMSILGKGEGYSLGFNV